MNINNTSLHQIIYIIDHYFKFKMEKKKLKKNQIQFNT